MLSSRRASSSRAARSGWSCTSASRAWRRDRARDRNSSMVESSRRRCSTGRADHGSDLKFDAAPVRGTPAGGGPRASRGLCRRSVQLARRASVGGRRERPAPLGLSRSRSVPGTRSPRAGQPPADGVLEVLDLNGFKTTFTALAGAATLLLAHPIGGRRQRWLDDLRRRVHAELLEKSPPLQLGGSGRAIKNHEVGRTCTTWPGGRGEAPRGHPVPEALDDIPKRSRISRCRYDRMCWDELALCDMEHPL